MKKSLWEIIEPVAGGEKKFFRMHRIKKVASINKDDLYNASNIKQTFLKTHGTDGGPGVDAEMPVPVKKPLKKYDEDVVSEDDTVYKGRTGGGWRGASAHINSKLSEHLDEAIFGAGRYEWRKYHGKEGHTLSFRGHPHHIGKGDTFGIRHATSKGGTYRVIVPHMGTTRVMSVDHDEAHGNLLKHSKRHDDVHAVMRLREQYEVDEKHTDMQLKQAAEYHGVRGGPSSLVGRDGTRSSYPSDKLRATNPKFFRKRDLHGRAERVARKMLNARFLERDVAEDAIDEKERTKAYRFTVKKGDEAGASRLHNFQRLTKLHNIAKKTFHLNTNAQASDDAEHSPKLKIMLRDRLGKNNPNSSLQRRRGAYAGPQDVKKGHGERTDVYLHHRSRHEGVENIDELSKSTLLSYTKKASRSKDRHGAAGDREEDKAMSTDGNKYPAKQERHNAAARGHHRKWFNRNVGLDRSTKKLRK